MTGSRAIHGIFTIERTYDEATASVFAAFSTQEARNGWGETGDQQPPEDDGAEEVTEFDPEMRQGGTIVMIDGLTAYLQRQ